MEEKKEQKEKKEINIIIGKRIKAARKAAGLTQERFAEMIPLAAKNISDIERGVVGISLGSLMRICEVLSVSSDELLFGAPSKNSADSIAARLNRLPPKQLEIALEMINKLFEAFASSK